MNEDDKESILHDLNIKIGSDINDLSNAYELENKLVTKRKDIQSQVSFTYFYSLLVISGLKYLKIYSSKYNLYSNSVNLT